MCVRLCMAFVVSPQYCVLSVLVCLLKLRDRHGFEVKQENMFFLSSNMSPYITSDVASK